MCYCKKWIAYNGIRNTGGFDELCVTFRTVHSVKFRTPAVKVYIVHVNVRLRMTKIIGEIHDHIQSLRISS